MNRLFPAEEIMQERMRIPFLLLPLWVSIGCCADWRSRPVAGSGAEITRGAALSGRTLYTWGRRAVAWDLSSGSKRVLATSAAGFGEGGCAGSLRDGGQPSLFLQEGNAETAKLIRVDPGGKRTEIDHGIEMHDCLVVTLLGHRGLLITQHGMQVRFYEERGDFWPYTEIYSFYTASYQGGLQLADIDGDGRPDILCGNYWIQSPESSDLPWRLFAIELYNEHPRSAQLRLAYSAGQLVVAQGEMAEARLALLHRPDDPKQLWTETRLREDLHDPHALAWPFVGENHGPGSRLFRINGTQLEQIGITRGVHSAFVTEDGILVTVGADGILTWRSEYRP